MDRPLRFRQGFRNHLPAIPFLRDAPGPEVQRRTRGPQESRGRARKAQAEKRSRK